jgi:hypothetical protein
LFGFGKMAATVQKASSATDDSDLGDLSDFLRVLQLHYSTELFHRVITRFAQTDYSSNFTKNFIEMHIATQSTMHSSVKVQSSIKRGGREEQELPGNTSYPDGVYRERGRERLRLRLRTFYSATVNKEGDFNFRERERERQFDNFAF